MDSKELVSTKKRGTSYFLNRRESYANRQKCLVADR